MDELMGQQEIVIKSLGKYINSMTSPRRLITSSFCTNLISSGEISSIVCMDPNEIAYFSPYQDGNNVVIEVRDDGNGIDVEGVKAKAIEKGTITPEQAD